MNMRTLLNPGGIMALLALQLVAHTATAQKRNFNWIFGSGVWLQFSADTMVFVPMQDTVSNRNACISDTAGHFVLLADDFGLRNALFQQVEGGSTQELGWNVPAGNYLILPMPGHPALYAVLVNELPPSSRAGYVLVNMAANNGAGAVMGGTTWYMENITAKLSATTDATDTGYWVVQHLSSGDAFHAFRLDGSGMANVPVISHSGSSFIPGPGSFPDLDLYGQMNFNPLGTTLAMVVHGPSNDTSKVEVFQFDRTTGQVSFLATIRPKEHGGMFSWYATVQGGVDFDLSGRYLLVPEISVTHSSYLPVSYDLFGAPDSISILGNTITGFLGQTSFGFDDTYGLYFSTAPEGYQAILAGESSPSPNGYLVRRICSLPGVGIPLPYVQSIMTIVLPDLDINWVSHTHLLPPMPPLGGLPAPCKRYHLGDGNVGIGEARPAALMGSYPNPMVDNAVLVFNGPVKPETVIWRDSLGRVVRHTAVGHTGLPFLLERGNLPTGLYFVEVFGQQGSAGQIKVICR